MNENMFEPSLKNDNTESTKTYDIKKLFYVAFFGGLIPILILGTLNATWLKVEKWKVNVLISIGILLMIFLYPLLMYFQLKSREFQWAFRIVAVVLYLAYEAIMKNNFNQHILLGGEMKPILKDAVIWSLVGILVQLILFFVGGVFIEYVK